MLPIEMVTIAVLAVIGAILAAALGWFESTDPFDGRKFVATVIRGSFGALVLALTTFIDPTIPATVATYLAALLAGAGFDVLLKRGYSALTSTSK
jgi:hypothetical protein